MTVTSPMNVRGCLQMHRWSRGYGWSAFIFSVVSLLWKWYLQLDILYLVHWWEWRECFPFDFLLTSGTLGSACVKTVYGWQTSWWDYINHKNIHQKYPPKPPHSPFPVSRKKHVLFKSIFILCLIDRLLRELSSSFRVIQVSCGKHHNLVLTDGMD